MKRRRKAPDSAAASPAQKIKPVAQVVPSQPVPEETLFPIRSYVIMNIVFDAFCLLLLGLIYVVLSETKGLLFFFGLLMFGFFLVSVFDYFYDRMAARNAGSEI